MYISNLSHFLDETGRIPTHIPKQAREMGNFLALLVDETTKNHKKAIFSTNIRCFQKKCTGTIESKLIKETNEIRWFCSSCENAGIISGWERTRWDNR